MAKKIINYVCAAFAALSLMAVPVSVLAEGTGKDAASVVEQAAGLAGITDKLNINTASAEMLEKIPGIGPTIGSAIETYRNANGAFESLSDLMKVDGIDMELLEKITPFLSL